MNRSFNKFKFSRCVTLIGALTAALLPHGIFANGGAIDPYRELVIIEPSVVDDPTRTYDLCNQIGNPDGEWTIGHLFTQIANKKKTGIEPEELARVWAEQMVTAVTINGGTADTATESLRVLGQWIQASGGPGQPLDLDKAPFRLVAIVNRIDLRTDQHAGEVRFVFGGINMQGCDLAYELSASPFSVILEYQAPGSSYKEQKKWGEKWHALSKHALGSNKYNKALAKITQKVTKAGANKNQLPNKSALLTLRTNAEIDEGREWQLREFRLADQSDPIMGGYIDSSTLTTTPFRSFNKSNALSDYMNANALAIADNTHTVPLNSDQNGLPMAGAAAISLSGGFEKSIWEASAAVPVNNETRHLFSLNTCNGCHSLETGALFVHINPERGAGQPALLSNFMTGVNVNDPVDFNTIRHFNEIDRRAVDFDGLLHQPQALQVQRKKPSQSH